MKHFAVAMMMMPMMPNPTELAAHVEKLCGTRQPRNYSNVAALNETAEYIFSTWQKLGLKPRYQPFAVAGTTYKNVLLSLGPEKASRIIIGAHYDVAEQGPGADDNASGVAGLLELSKLLKPIEASLKHRIDLVAFTLEEPPYFGSGDMGSAVHARSLKEEDVQVDLMMSLEMIGYYSDVAGSQRYPMSALKLLYGDRGNFISVIGDLTSPWLVRKVRRLMAENSEVAVESLNAPTSLEGVSLSDHRSYWQEGFPAVMITDTAFFRNGNYHQKTDLPKTLNYEKMAQVVRGVFAVATKF